MFNTALVRDFFMQLGRADTLLHLHSCFLFLLDGCGDYLRLSCGCLLHWSIERSWWTQRFNPVAFYCVKPSNPSESNLTVFLWSPPSCEFWWARPPWNPLLPCVDHHASYPSLLVGLTSCLLLHMPLWILWSQTKKISSAPTLLSSACLFLRSSVLPYLLLNPGNL